MVFDDLAHVVDLDAAVPALLGVHDDGDAARALVQAAGRVGAHAPLDAALVQQALELVAHGLAALLGTAPLRIAGIAPVRADEHVLFEVRLRHSLALPSRGYTRQTKRAGVTRC